MNVILLASLLLAQPAPELVESVSTPMNDYNLSITDDHRTLVVARSEADFRNARIYIATRASTDEAWGAPQPIGFSDPRWSDSDPWLTPDGGTLYFISTRPHPARAEGRADYDIWRARRTAGGWSEPERLPDSVNSAGQELGPELHDGMLYFASARRSGRGGLDIYRAVAQGESFAQAALLEGPFNSASSDSDFTLSGDGRTAAFWRSGDNGTAQILVARRTEDGWTDPAPLPGAINHGPFNFTPSFTRNGRGLLYASTRPREGQEAGLADIYWARLPD
jgi:Tol biopolymer transport system component